MPTNRQLQIEVTFTLGVVPDNNGKVTSDIVFKVPGHPEFTFTDKIRRYALEQVAGLSKAVLDHGLPQGS